MRAASGADAEDSSLTPIMYRCWQYCARKGSRAFDSRENRSASAPHLMTSAQSVGTDKVDGVVADSDAPALRVSNSYWPANAGGRSTSNAIGGCVVIR